MKANRALEDYKSVLKSLEDVQKVKKKSFQNLKKTLKVRNKEIQSLNFDHD